jgi:hypothetical protein
MKKPKTQIDLAAAATKRTPTRIRCDYCGQFAPYGTEKCPHCGGKLDYSDETDIVYAESFDLKAYNKSLELAGKAKKKTAVSRQKGVAKGCLISFLSIAAFVIVISLIANTSSKNHYTTPDTTASESAKNVLSEPVTFEKNGVKLTVKEFINGGYHGEGLSVTLENGTSGEIDARSSFIIINGITFDISFYSEYDIGAGKSISNVLYLRDYDSALQLAGTFKNIELVFTVKDQEYESLWEHEHIALECNPEQPEPTAPSSEAPPGRLILDRMGVQVYVAEIRTRDSAYALVAELVVKNNSGKDIDFSVNDNSFSVNGMTFVQYAQAYAADGTVAYLSIALTKNQLAEQGVTEVKTVECGFEVQDMVTYGYLFVSEPLPLTETETGE